MIAWLKRYLRGNRNSDILTFFESLFNSQFENKLGQEPEAVEDDYYEGNKRKRSKSAADIEPVPKKKDKSEYTPLDPASKVVLAYLNDILHIILHI